MDKTFLLRVNNSFKKIKTKLLLNEKIRKLLYYDVVSDSMSAPLIEQVKDHIFLQPVINVETTEPFNKKSYITITVPEGNPSGNKIKYVVRLTVMCEKSVWNINGDIRPLIISQEIINTLNGFKTDMSNALDFSRIVETVTSKDVVGYSILFNITDGISDVDEQ